MLSGRLISLPGDDTIYYLLVPSYFTWVVYLVNLRYLPQVFCPGNESCTHQVKLTRWFHQVLQLKAYLTELPGKLQNLPGSKPTQVAFTPQVTHPGSIFRIWENLPGDKNWGTYLVNFLWPKTPRYLSQVNIDYLVRLPGDFLPCDDSNDSVS